MSTIKQFNRQACNRVSEEAMEALEMVAEQFGLTLKKANGRYNDDSYTFKVEFQVTPEEGQASIDEANFRKYAPLMGAEANWFGQTFLDGRSHFKIVGINTRAPKNCIQLQNVESGARYKCGVAYVRSHL